MESGQWMIVNTDKISKFVLHDSCQFELHESKQDQPRQHELIMLYNLICNNEKVTWTICFAALQWQPHSWYHALT